MPVTIKVNGSSNSLVHKGSNGLAKCTAPDVCKTPSPAGPVPLPYPVIVSMSSDLDKGSTTVKADGGNMIGIKDCEFSRCTGDEAGTAGGVVSSTFGKEAKFILYSFDVKIDGGNACRLGDKMTMNHANTFCLQGEQQAPAETDEIKLKCEDGWSDCQKKQMKAKAAKMDAAAKKGKIKTRSTAGRIRKAANSWAAKFARDWNNANPSGWPDSGNPSKQSEHFYDDCAKTNDPLGNDMQADHVQEVQLGGRVHGPFLWLDAAVNGASGRQIKSARSKGITKPSGFTTENCD